MPKRFATKRIKATIIPLFEWAVDPDGHAIIEDGKTDYDEVFEVINRKCLDWLNIENHLIVQYSFGFEKELDEGTKYWDAENLKFMYRADERTSVMGIILDGSLSTRNSSISDFCKVLGIDQFYALGLLHGLDNLSGYFVRPELKLNDSYITGYGHGEELAARYIFTKGGYNAKAA